MLRLIFALLMLLFVAKNTYGQDIHGVGLEFSAGPGITIWSEKYSAENNGSVPLPLPDGKYRKGGLSLNASLEAFYSISKSRLGLFICMNKMNFDKIEYAQDKSLTKQIDSDILAYGVAYGYTFYQKGNLNITPTIKLGSSIMSTGEAYTHFKNKLILGGGMTIAKTVNKINLFISPSYTLFHFKEINKITYGVNRNYDGSVSVWSLAAGLRIPL